MKTRYTVQYKAIGGHGEMVWMVALVTESKRAAERRANRIANGKWCVRIVTEEIN